MVLIGEGLRRLPAAASLAERLPVPRMRLGQGLGNDPRSTAVCWVPATDLGDRGDDLRGHTQAPVNRRRARARGLLFYRLLRQAVNVDPVPYRSLVGGTQADHNI